MPDSNRRLPVFETLDSRTLFAAVVGGLLRLEGGGGDDEIMIAPGAERGQVVVHGVFGVENGQLFSDVIQVVVHGRGGNDSIRLKGSFDLLPANHASGFRLFGDRGNDTLAGIGGIRIEYDGGRGSDMITGRGGAVLRFESAVHGVNVQLSKERVLDDGTGQSDVVVGVDEVFGTPFSDTLRGGRPDLTDRRHQSLHGGAGEDRIIAGNVRVYARGDKGNDTLVGGDQDDVMSGDAGADFLDGKGGRNTLAFLEGPVGAVVHLADGEGQDSFGARDTFRNFRDLFGSPNDDTLVGDDGPNEIRGGTAGRDFLEGGKGKDSFYVDFPGREESVVLGGDGNDFIRQLRTHKGLIDGGPGEDTIESYGEPGRKPIVRVE